ncbi:MAG TPA: hypothetical protein VFM70_11425 [Salinimicrobium sp.]|nr:hypothetical protein [Salinimicrobium sp.]
MRNKILIFILTVATIVMLIIIWISNNYVNELEHQLETKSNIIERSGKSDSLLVEKTKEYANKIEEYVENCNFYVDGKEISQQEVIRMVNTAMEENSKLKDSIQKLKFIIKATKNNYGISINVERSGDTLFARRNPTKIDTALAYLPKVKEQQKRLQQVLDSLEIYKWQAELTQNNFGISYKIKKEGSTLTSTRSQNAKIDSALVLLKYYRHRLLKDENGDWVIETDREYRKMEKKRNKE